MSLLLRWKCLTYNICYKHSVARTRTGYCGLCSTEKFNRQCDKEEAYEKERAKILEEISAKSKTT